MMFISDLLCQKMKTGYTVCGDNCACARSDAGTAYVLCDGIGSGIYANIAAILCTERLIGMIRRGVSFREAAELVAGSMHRAREEDTPYSAFSAAFIYPDGYFTTYTYEAPTPILISENGASVLPVRFYTVGYEVIAETEGKLQLNENLVLMSDGVTQSGMGHGYGMGIGSEGIAEFINHALKSTDVFDIPEKVAAYCARVSEGRFEDDTTFAMLHCREAVELTLLTGPPSSLSGDKVFAELILNSQAGKKVVCGSTTIDIISRELGVTVETKYAGGAFGIPPEYALEGVDLATEGAIMLNQLCNVIDEPLELFEDDNVVTKLCLMLREADVIHMHIGNAQNNAHESLLFKQVGVRMRRSIVEILVEKLRNMGKLVIERYY